MKIERTISMIQTASGPHLAGAEAGRTWLRQVQASFEELPRSVALDFSGIQVATVSWLREAVVGFRRYASAMRPDLRTVAANVSPLVREELALALDAAGMVMVVGDLLEDQRLGNPQVLGRLDDALRETFEVASSRSLFDAPSLRHALPHVALSALNNRLASLEDKGLFESERRGRNRVYRPIIEGMTLWA